MNSDDLSARLKNLLLIDQSSSESPQPQKNDAVPMQRKSKPFDFESVATNNGNFRAKRKDDKAPPLPSFFKDSRSKVSIPSTRTLSQSSAQLFSSTMNPLPLETSAPVPTLAEQMMASAASAQNGQKQKQRNKQQQRAKNTTFGMKKGFLIKKGKPRLKETPDNVKKNAEEDDAGITRSGSMKQSNLILESDSKGNVVRSEYSSQDESKSISSAPITVTSQSSTPNSDPLHLPEVQDTLSSHLQSAQSKWASPTFLNSLAQHSTLSKGWNDPRYLVALESMKTHPKETMEKLKADEPEILHWLIEFLGVMGDHFVMLGEDNADKCNEEYNTVLLKKIAKEEEAPPKVREMGPMEEKAIRIRKAQPTPTNFQQQHEKSCLDDNEVTKILSNDGLRSILLDPKIQHVMEECASDSVRAGKLQYYLRHDDIGPKLRELMKAGLLQLA